MFYNDTDLRAVKSLICKEILSAKWHRRVFLEKVFFISIAPFCSFDSEESPPLPGVSGDSTKAEGKDGDQASLAVVPKGKKKKDDKDQIQIEVTAKLGGIGVTVTSVEGDLSHIIVGGE